MQKKLLLPAFWGKCNGVLKTSVLPAVGLILIAFAPHLTSYAAYLVGGAMLLTGILMLIHALLRREYASRETHNTAISIVLISCSLVVLLKHENCIPLLGTAWGLFGILSGVEDLTEALSRAAHRERFLLLLLDTVVTLALSILLLWNPDGSFSMHLRLLGLELILLPLRPPLEKKTSAADGISS